MGTLEMAVTVKEIILSLLLKLLLSTISEVHGTFLEDPVRRSSCITSGGQCGSLFPCLISMGIAAGSCGGFFSVCCVKPATVNRWLNDNRLNDEVNIKRKANWYMLPFSK